jgi:N-dimethylarginine dimethylaminohydrolase
MIRCKIVLVEFFLTFFAFWVIDYHAKKPSLYHSVEKIRNSHHPDRQFIIVHGTAVALKQDIPVAVFVQKGLTLRVFDETVFAEALVAFAEAFRKRCVFAALNRVTVKHYPAETAQALAGAGFERVMLDWVVYR